MGMGVGERMGDDPFCRPALQEPVLDLEDNLFAGRFLCWGW